MTKKLLLIFAAAVALSAQVRTGRNGLYFPGQTSGGLGMVVANVAGSAVTLVLPSDSNTASEGKMLAIGPSVTCPTLRPTFFPATCRSLSWAAASTAPPVSVQIPGGWCNESSGTGTQLISSSNGGRCIGALGGGYYGYGSTQLYLAGGTAVIQARIPVAFSSVDFNLLWANEGSSTQNINVATLCKGAGEAPDGTLTFNSPQTIASASGTNVQSGSITGLTVTGCSVGELLLIKLTSSTTDAYADLIQATLTFNQ